MITLKDYMETVDYRITEGSEYGWSCFGPDAYCIDSWDGDQEGCNINVVFSTKDQTVYQVEAHDFAKNRSYRWINPNYVDAVKEEAKSRGHSFEEAYDEVNFTDLEVAEDMLDKARAIFLYEDYDTRVKVPIDLPDDVLFTMMKMAHEADMTFNQFAEKLLKEELDRFEATR
jgi:hypothetical protein